MNCFFYIYFVYFWGSRYFLGTGTTMYVINERIHLLHTFSCIKSWVLDFNKSRLWSIPNFTSCYVPSNLEWVIGSWPISFQFRKCLEVGKCLGARGMARGMVQKISRRNGINLDHISPSIRLVVKSQHTFLT